MPNFLPTLLSVYAPCSHRLFTPQVFIDDAQIRGSNTAGRRVRRYVTRPPGLPPPAGEYAAAVAKAIEAAVAAGAAAGTARDAAAAATPRSSGNDDEAAATPPGGALTPAGSDEYFSVASDNFSVARCFSSLRLPPSFFFLSLYHPPISTSSLLPSISTHFYS